MAEPAGAGLPDLCNPQAGAPAVAFPPLNDRAAWKAFIAAMEAAVGPGHDLRDPYLSPLFGDFTKGFAPSLLTTGTRDLLLSNTVLLHRALRAADIPAELHITEAAGHGGLPQSPEGEAIDRDIRGFVQRCLGED